jgi:hypothetical protein
MKLNEPVKSPALFRIGCGLLLIILGIMGILSNDDFGYAGVLFGIIGCIWGFITMLRPPKKKNIS